MRSGQLAHLTGISTDTLRHYERLGLLPLPQRTAGNYREYPSTSLRRVELIQDACIGDWFFPLKRAVMSVRSAA
jgi:DNA-binding transcriptional MerR regulator